VRRQSDLDLAVPRAHALVGPIVSVIFRELRLSASIVDLQVPSPSGGWSWYPIHSSSGVLPFELAHGAEKRREAHNVRCVDRVRGEAKVVIAEHAGFYDAYVPVADSEALWGVMIAGPFAVGSPTTSDLLARWRWLTGKHGRVSDAEFAHYVSMTLGTTTFSSAQLATFKRFLRCMAKLFRGRVRRDEIVREIDSLASELFDVRYGDRMWDAARAMLEEPSWRAWHSPHARNDIRRMGLKGPPEHVAVGLLVGRAERADPLEDTLKRDAFQRACVDMSRKIGGFICGRVGDHGVALLASQGGGPVRVRAKLLEIAGRAASLARRYDQRLHVGIGGVDDRSPLPTRFQAALAAAERALSHGQSILHAEPGRPSHEAGRLGQMRRDLSKVVVERPNLLLPSFDRYLEAVRVHCGYRFEPTRAHLEAGIDQVVNALRSTLAVDERSLDELERTLGRVASEVNTVEELSEAYRRAISDVALATSRPKDARQDRSVRRALSFIRDHFGERLTLEQVAKVAGFAPRYFSRLFAKAEHTTFQLYVRRLRLERAKHMITATQLSIERVAQLCGFPERIYFHRAFKQAFGMTPLEYRSRAELHPKALRVTPRRAAAR
jgi:AraC-like DNA-binding protein